jgi:hypothetical protein
MKYFTMRPAAAGIIANTESTGPGKLDMASFISARIKFAATLSG